MPSPTTAYDLIKGAFRVAGITSSGETPTADEANDALSTLNDLFETMTTQDLYVYGSTNDVFATVPGQASYTIGPTGGFVTDRPVRITGGYTTYQTVDFPIQFIGQDEYNYIELKSMQQQYAERAVYINDFPNGVLILWPVPSLALPLTLSIDRVITNVPTLATAITFPPGYLNYLKNALALMIAPEYGLELPPAVSAIARDALAWVKRANKVRRFAQFDCGLGNNPFVTWQRGH